MNFITVTVVPLSLAIGVLDKTIPCESNESLWARGGARDVVIATIPIEQSDERASPRNPNDEMRVKSSNFDNLEVQCFCAKVAKSADEIPEPLSVCLIV